MEITDEIEKEVIKAYRQKKAARHVDALSDEQIDIDDITPEKINDPVFLANTIKAIQRAIPKE